MAGVQHAQLDETTLEWLTDRVVDSIGDALARGEPVAAAALHLVLRRFSVTAREDMAEPLGAALAREVDRQAQQGCDDDCESWIALFSEAAAVSEDPRLPRAAADLLEGLRARWSSHEAGCVDQIMRSVEACLLSVNVPEARELAADAIDALERVVAGAYRPGQGVSHEIAKTSFVRGGLSDHVRSASALLTAYTLTARLPYAMLADELMQSVLRTPPDEPGDRDVSFALDCELARVFCRLAALHRDEEYRRTAVLAVNEDYGADAAQTLTALASSVHERGVEAAPFGLALAEWLNLQ
ncbi:MAG TPA: hypothetical protein VGJ39_03390 [Vicinamibacterales bacterium]|jgi:hypothetical protein